MTVSSSAYKTTVAGNGATTTFSYSFTILAASHASLIYTDATGVSTTLAGGLWSITGTGFNSTGGTFTYPLSGSPIANGTSLTLVRTTPQTQALVLPPTGTVYPPNVEQALDALTMEVQEIAGTYNNRAVRQPVSDAVFMNELPVAALRVGFMMFDINGNPVVGALSPNTAPISTAMQPVVAAASLAAARTAMGVVASVSGTASALTATGGLTVTGGSNVTGGETVAGNLTMTSGGLDMSAAGSPSILAATSIGNAIASYNQHIIKTTTSHASNWENASSIQMTNNLGHAAGQNKVALYTAIEATGSTAGDSWAFNPLLMVDSGAIPNQAHQVAEFDMANNSGTNFHDTQSSFGPPAIWGMQITGISTNRCTTAIAILGNIAGTLPMWNRGITFSNLSVRNSALQDFTGCTTSLDIWGSHTYALDTYNSAISGAAIRMAAGHPVASRNVGNTADLNLIQLDVSDRVFIGNATSTDVLIQGPNVGPSADNVATSGKAIARWSGVWAVNGAIQTSDPSLKTNIAALPAVLPLVMTLQPKTFKWISGGKEPVEVTRTVRVRDVETYEDDDSSVEMVGGVATLVTKKITREMPAYDEVPVVNHDGTPSMTVIPGKAAVLDGAGRVVRAAVPDQTVQRLHREPRYVMKTETVKELQDAPGKRTHWGFMAPDVKAAFDAIGMDFGGYVQSEDGTQHLRPDQLIPVLWKAVQELNAEVQALKARIA
jgi:hypothetical protein